MRMRLFVSFFLLFVITGCSTMEAWVSPNIVRDKDVLFTGFSIINQENQEYSKNISDQLCDGLKVHFLKSGFKVIEKVKFVGHYKTSGELMSKEPSIETGFKTNPFYVVSGSGRYYTAYTSPYIKQFNIKMVRVDTGETVMAITWSGSDRIGTVIEKLGFEIEYKVNKSLNL